MPSWSTRVCASFCCWPSAACSLDWCLGLLLILLSFLVSGALSLVWLDRPRSQMSAGVGKAIGRVNERIDAAAASEDDLQEIDVTDEPADETSALRASPTRAQVRSAVAPATSSAALG